MTITITPVARMPLMVQERAATEPRGLGGATMKALWAAVIAGSAFAMAAGTAQAQAVSVNVGWGGPRYYTVSHPYYSFSRYAYAYPAPAYYTSVYYPARYSYYRR